MKYTVISPLHFDGEKYEIGETVEMTAKQANEASEAVKPSSEKARKEEAEKEKPGS